MQQTYQGGCHCGTVRYEVDADLSAGTLKCNCSMCGKSRAWLAAVRGADFRLLTAEEALGTYQFNKDNIRHHFCKRCGIKSFSRGKGAGGAEFVAVAISCLEGIEDETLAALPVMHVDGRHDDFTKAPAVTSHL